MFRRISLLSVLVCLCLRAPLAGADIVVDGVNCTLPEAIRSANTDTAVDGCTAGAGADQLLLDTNVTLTAPDTSHSTTMGVYAGLPDITTAIAITARNGNTIQRDPSLACTRLAANRFRLLNVLGAEARLTLNGLTLKNGCATGGTGHGGAIHVSDGWLTLSDSTFEANRSLGDHSSNTYGGNASGGAVTVNDGTVPAISNSRFVGNLSEGGDGQGFGGNAWGAALYLSGSAVGTIGGCEFRNNIARGGDISGGSSSAAGGHGLGGAVNLEGANASIESIVSSVFIGNRAEGGSSSVGAGGTGRGGAIRLNNATVDIISNVLFESNEAEGGTSAAGGGYAHGGALHLIGGSTIDLVERTTFVANDATGGIGSNGGSPARGGALYSAGTIAELHAVTFAHNTAAGSLSPSWVAAGDAYGGAIYATHSMNLVAATISANEAHGGAGTTPGSGTGGGVRLDLVAGQWVSIRNTAIADNVATTSDGEDCLLSAGTLLSFGHNHVGDPTGGCTFAAEGDVTGGTADLQPIADYGCVTALPTSSCLPTMRPLPTSALVDNGDCSDFSGSPDARGATRPVDLPLLADGGDGCDVGAVEFDAADPEAQITATPDRVVGTPGAAATLLLEVTNNGPLASPPGLPAAVDLVVPEHVALVSVVPGTGTWSPDPGTWTLPDLSPGQTASLTVQIEVEPGLEAQENLSATLEIAAGGAIDWLTGNNAATVVLPILPLHIFSDGFESGGLGSW